MAAIALSMTAASADEVVLNVNDATNIQAGKLVDEVAAAGSSSGTAKHYENVTALEIDGYSFAFDKASGSTAVAYYYTMSTSDDTQNTIRLYKGGNTMTITAPQGVEMTTIDIKGSNGTNGSAPTVSTGTATAPSSSEIIWEGSANSVTFTTVAAFRIKTLTITTGSSDMVTVEMPTFTPESGTTFTDKLTVTIAGVEGADIYYTLDGTNPTTDSSKYEAPIELTATTTVKAIAVKEGMNNSGIASATYTKEETRATLEELIIDGLDDENTEFTYTGRATVTYVNGSNLYIKDETAALLVYGKLNTTYSQGDVITGFKGKFKNYYGTYELMATAKSFGEPIEKVEVEPTAFTIGTLTATDQNQYIILSNVTVVNADDVIALRSGDDEVPMYNKFSVEIPTDGTERDVIGVISYFQNKGDDAPSIQIYPIEFYEANAIEAVEAETGVAEYFSINGVRVNGNNLQPGIYVVRANGKAHKVIVK